MRLFHNQPVYNQFDNNNVIPPPPPPPPFLADEEEERSLSLLRESTTHLREGRQRLPTPDKVAIMELSTSFDKRRLGKQQQILSEITQRCREQEVTDLSSKISAKVAIKSSAENPEDFSGLRATGSRRHMRSRGHNSPNGSLTPADPRDLDTIEARLQFEKGYKFFPARSIIRHPSRAQLFQPAVCKPGEGGGGGGADHGDGSTRPCTQHAASTDDEVQPLTLDRQTTKGSIILPSSVQPSLGAVPPLLLASAGRSLDSRQQDRIGYCFSSSRLPLSQRSRTYFDSSRNSGRSFRNPPTFRSTASRQQVRSERGLHTMIQSILSDMSVKMHLHGKRRARSREIRVPMDLGSATSRLRSETQKV